MPGDFNIETDIIGIADVRENIGEIVDSVARDHAQKVIIKNGKPAAVIMNVADYQSMQNRLLAFELETGLAAALDEEAHGDLIDLDDLATEFGLDPKTLPTSEAPSDYDQLVPKRYRSAS